ncbi:zinc finger BED domain-containing protein RICESLEEPER 2 [Artemisia annua]|uniref:Zinc finger BED domain-containing protein RICESLEEPER 2 n=1 Tax=Artemisia annua TaxID=35608 RepID=A0A2U1MDR6_ARTAN|nr:zinc finger BED domain-containing protein RICESLEEPER 2 [Artemisia annua]
MARDLLALQASTVVSESAFSTSGRILSIRRTRLTPASLEMCICLKDHLNAAERILHTSSLEDPLEYEEQIQNEEVREGDSTHLFDEEITQDNEASEARSSEDDLI